jgi:uncharacterized protein Yka (UPF0111/DUF47 family)
MISLQRLLAKDTKFFDLLEASAEQACRSVLMLSAAVKTPDSNHNLDEFVRSRRAEKRITEEISEKLCTTFITPLEREDIEALSAVLDKIPKTAEKFGERLRLCQTQLRGSYFIPQIDLLTQCTTILLEMVKVLRGNPEVESVKEKNERLQHLEGEADKLMLELLRDLYSGRHDALQVLSLRHLYELLEKLIDRCRDAGNVVFRTVLKYS